MSTIRTRTGWIAASAVVVLIVAGLAAWFLVFGGGGEESGGTAETPTSGGTAEAPTSSNPSADESSGASDERECIRRTSAVIDAAVRDIVARGDVGEDYDRATRRYGDQSEAWRLASRVFPPVYAQLDAQGAASARSTARALISDACGRLHDPGKSKRVPNLRGAKPIRVPKPESEPTASASPAAARSCYVLEEAPRAYPGTYLTLDDENQYSDEAREVQSQLNWLGYGCTPEDGIYGPETEGLVRRFQSDYGLVVDGEVGPQTWNALFGV